MLMIKMLKTKKGTENGFAVKQFVEGEIYVVADSLGRYFIKEGCAKQINN